MSDISFNTACKELKIAQIAQLNLSTFAFSSYIRPLLLLGKSYANEQKCKHDVSKDSPIVVDIYRDAKRPGLYPPLFTDPEGVVVLVFTKSDG